MSAIRKAFLHPYPAAHLLTRRPVLVSPTLSFLCNRIQNDCMISNGSLCDRGGSQQREGQIFTSSALSHPSRSLHTSARTLMKASALASDPVKLAKLIATQGLNMQMSRRSAEGLIENGQVTIAGALVLDPGYKISVADVMSGGGIVKVAGRRLMLPKSLASQNAGEANATARTRIWLVNKFPGELVSEHDPEGRPSLLERMYRSGVGKPSRRVKKKGQAAPIHLKPIGRLDMMTEGLMLLTNDGKYAREMELPKNALHRTYRARVHGRMTPGKLKAIRSGVNIEGTFYKGMRVNLELNKGNRVKGGNTNSWIRVSCVEGKNRQVRRVLDHVGCKLPKVHALFLDTKNLVFVYYIHSHGSLLHTLKVKVTRLIRTSFGDYDLNTIPAGMAIEVPVKPMDGHKLKGKFLKNKRHIKTKENDISAESKAPAVEWVRCA